jgi:hypothetical protein
VNAARRPLKLKCSSCGFENTLGIKFCGKCGNLLGGTAKPEPLRDPRSYTPRHLAEKILSSRSAIEGERKQVTVLFADVKGSMGLAEEVGPEGWHEILDRFFQILTNGAHRFEGTVNQYTGDGVMALFGAPIAHEDHAPRACLASLYLRDTLRAYGEELRRTQHRSTNSRHSRLLPVPAAATTPITSPWLCVARSSAASSGRISWSFPWDRGDAAIGRQATRNYSDGRASTFEALFVRVKEKPIARTQTDEPSCGTVATKLRGDVNRDRSPA